MLRAVTFRKSVCIVLLFVTAALPANSAQAQNRFSLVIGNSNYHHATALKNTINDAIGISNSLNLVGFESQLLLDADKLQMEKAAAQLITSLEAEGGIGLVYYAGHGIQLSGRNYLVPVDAIIELETDIQEIGYDVSALLNQLKLAQNDVNIIILDACRNNPFDKTSIPSSRSIANPDRALKRLDAPLANAGLSRLEAPPNTLIAYATAPGKIALDGNGINSPYTAAIMENILIEGLTIEQVFKEVRAKVLTITDGNQIPWESSSLVREFYFKPRKTLPAGW